MIRLPRGNDILRISVHRWTMEHLAFELDRTHQEEPQTEQEYWWWLNRVMVISSEITYRLHGELVPSGD